MTHNIPLNILDEYAKIITSNQANMLYENKCNKKYKKKLYENKKYQSDEYYHIHLKNYILNDANISVTEALAKYANKFNLQYNILNDGIKFYTPITENYILLLKNLVNDGFNINSLCSVVESKNEKKFLKSLNNK